jgi:hypothetical protein
VAAIISAISGEAVRKELVPRPEAIAVALPDGEEADAVADCALVDVRMTEAPGAILKWNIWLKFPGLLMLKSVIKPSMSDALKEPDADPVPVMPVVMFNAPARVKSTPAVVEPLFVIVNVLSDVSCDVAVTVAACAGWTSATPHTTTTIMDRHAARTAG